MKKRETLFDLSNYEEYKDIIAELFLKDEAE